MASWRIRFHDKWPHLASLYANSHNLDEEGKHPDPMMGQDNVFDPAEPLGAYRYYLAPTPRSEFSIEEPNYVNRSFYKDEESRSSGYTSGDSFRRGSTCRVLLCVFLVFSFIGAVVAAITLAVILSQQTKPKLVPAPAEYYESTASALGETFTKNLTDPNSREYKALEERFCKAITEMFTTYDSPVKHEFADCEVIQFSNGSIRVTYRIKLQPGSPEGYKKSDKIEEKLLEHFVKKIGQTGPWKRIRWDPNFFRRFLKVEMTTVAPSPTTTMKPTNETTKPTKETTKLTKEPTKETTEPTKETTKLAKETTKPTNETTKPTEETTKPTKETTKLTKETTKSTEETTKLTTTRRKETTEISTSKTKATITTEFYESTAKALGETFTENLTDPNSEEFKTMEEKFCKAIEEMFKTEDSPVGQAFAGCEVIEFSNGSVRVRYRIKLQPSSTEGFKETDKIKEKLLEHFVKKISQTGPWNKIKWDRKFIRQFLKLEMTTVAPSPTTPTKLTKLKETTESTTAERIETTEISTNQTKTTTEVSAETTESFTVETTSDYNLTKSTAAVIESTEPTDKIHKKNQTDFVGTLSTKSVFTSESVSTLREENMTSSKPIQNITEVTPVYSIVTDKTADSTTTFADDIIDPFFNETYWFYDNFTSTETPQTDNVTTESDRITDKKPSHAMALESTTVAPAAENVTMTDEVKSSTAKEVTSQHPTNITDSVFTSSETERVTKQTTAAAVNTTTLTTKLKTDEVSVMKTSPTVSETVLQTSEPAQTSSTESFVIIVTKEEAVVDPKNWTHLIDVKNLTVEPAVETTVEPSSSTEAHSKLIHSSTAEITSVPDPSTASSITETEEASLAVTRTAPVKSTITDTSETKQTTSKETASMEVTTTERIVTETVSLTETSATPTVTEKETVTTTAGTAEIVTSQIASDAKSTTEEFSGTTETDVVTQSTVNTIQDVIKTVTTAAHVTESTLKTDILSTHLEKEDKSTEAVPTETTATEAVTSLVSEELTTTPFTESTVTETAVTDSVITERQDTTKVKADISSTYKASTDATEEMVQEFTTQHSTLVSQVVDALSTDRTVTTEKVHASTDETFVPSTTLQVDLLTTMSSPTSEPAIVTENQTDTSAIVSKTTATEPSIHTKTTTTEMTTESATISADTGTSKQVKKLTTVLPLDSTVSGDREMSTSSTSVHVSQAELATEDQTKTIIPSTVIVTEVSTETPRVVEETSSATESTTVSESTTIVPSTLKVAEVSTMTPQVVEETSSKMPETSTHIILETSTPTTEPEIIIDADQSTIVPAAVSEHTTTSRPTEDFTLSAGITELKDRPTSEFQTSPTVKPSMKAIEAVTETEKVIPTLTEKVQNITRFSTVARVMTTMHTTPEKEETGDMRLTEKLSTFAQTTKTTTGANTPDFASETVDQMTDTTPSPLSPTASLDKTEITKIPKETASAPVESSVGPDIASSSPRTIATTNRTTTVTEKSELPFIKLTDQVTDFTSKLPTFDKTVVETSATAVPTKPRTSKLPFISEETPKTTEVKTIDLSSASMTMTPIVITEKSTGILLEETLNTTESIQTTSMSEKTAATSTETMPTQDTTTVQLIELSTKVTEKATTPEIIKTDTSAILTTDKKHPPTGKSTLIVTKAAKFSTPSEGTSQTPAEFKPTKTGTETQSTRLDQTTTTSASTETMETTIAGKTETTTTQPDETTTAYDEFYMFYDNTTDYYDNYTDYTSTVSAETEAVTEGTTLTTTLSAEATTAGSEASMIDQTVTSTATKTTLVSDLHTHTSTMPVSVTAESSPVPSVSGTLSVVPSTVSIEPVTASQKERPTVSSMEARSETTAVQAALETSKITIGVDEKESITRTTLSKPSNFTSVKMVSIIDSEATMFITNQTTVRDDETTTIIPEISTDNATATTASQVNETFAEAIITDADNTTAEYNETSTESSTTTAFVDTETENVTIDYNATTTFDYYDNDTLSYYYNETTTESYLDSTTEETLSNNTTGAQTSLVNTSPDSSMSSTMSDQQTSTNVDSTTSTSDTLL